MNREEAVKIVVMLQGFYWHTPLPDAAARVLTSKLSEPHYTFAAARQFVTAWVDDHEWLPKWCDMRAGILRIQRIERESSPDPALTDEQRLDNQRITAEALRLGIGAPPADPSVREKLLKMVRNLANRFSLPG